MKKTSKAKTSYLLIASFILSAVSFNSLADSYDPSTNVLTIPSITVNGITYNDVAVTVGEILSIGSSFEAPVDHPADRKCKWSFVTDNPYYNIEYDLVIRVEAKTITVSMTGMNDSSSFYPFNVDLVQGNQSTAVTPSEFEAGVLWTGDDGFTAGKIPAGVVKTGTLSRFPEWFDFAKPFTWIGDADNHICD